MDQAGAYHYTVRERKGDAEGITYDETVYGVKVVVTDNLDGTFKVEYSYSKGAEAASGGLLLATRYLKKKEETEQA